MWRFNDWIVNIILDIRLWFFINFNPKRFLEISNDINKDGWNITFNDEFDNNELDRNKWRTDSYYGYRYHPGNIINKNKAPDEYYSDSYFEFKDNLMLQKATDDPKKIHHIDWDGKDWGEWVIPYQIGKIDSSISFEQKYGYFEIRSKMPDQLGHWTAFWLASVHDWPPEIDIYEIYTGQKRGKGIKRFNSNFHWDSTPNKKMKPKSHRVMDTSKGFHIYAVEWDSKSFKIYYDNLLVRVFSNPKCLEFFEHPMHIIANNGIDVDPKNGVSEVDFPTYHEVDYIRAYELHIS